MSDITFFTTKLENGSTLFGQKNDLKAIKGNEELSRVLLETFPFDDFTIRSIWKELPEEYKIKVIEETWPDEKEVSEDCIENKDNLDEAVLKTIWDNQKENILSKSRKTGFWSVYPAKKKDAYALGALSTGRTLCDWTKSLIQIAKRLNSSATTINLVLHDRDVGIDVDYRVYSEDELGMEAETLSNFKKEWDVEHINVILFQHSNGVPVMNRLLNYEHLEDVNEEVKKMVEEAKKAKEEAKKENLDSNNTTFFDNKLQRASKGEEDPIGVAYSKN